MMQWFKWIIDREERIDVLGLCDEEDYFRWDSKEKLELGTFVKGRVEDVSNYDLIVSWKMKQGDTQ